ncbi:MAG: citramalate synthase [Nitrospiraceae bacterium]|nr:citramalate synthase [Nitrospiraceae bacterium]
MKRTVHIYDTTLRDGSQAEDVNFSVEDKIRVAKKLDEFGVHYIEGGWPGSNPRDIEFFREMRKVRLRKAKLVAFGSTRRAKLRVAQDPNIRSLVSSGVGVTTIFGKTWDLHVQKALRITLEQNLEIIGDSVAYLKKRMDEVIYDAEHFFDGYKANPDYALQTLLAARDAGADCLVLCDTNGGTLPGEVSAIIDDVKRRITAPFGIHAHNDAELAVANSLAAIRLGAVQVHGTINGYGERCGNANLCAIIPTLKLKMDIDCITDGNLRKLRELSRYVDELANMPHRKRQPYVGDSAFAHKGGIHVDAVAKLPRTYEHIVPEQVGNRRRVLVSDLAGKSNILQKAKELGISLEQGSPELAEILRRIKQLENEGFEFEGAEGSLELLMLRARHSYESVFSMFDRIDYRVLTEKRKVDPHPVSEATITVEYRGTIEHTAAWGNGPVNALDKALRKVLPKYFPGRGLENMRLLDYKVRVLTAAEGTAARVRVLIESGDGKDKWGTVGVSENVIEASWQALVDGIEYKLLRSRKKSV